MKEDKKWNKGKRKILEAFSYKPTSAAERKRINEDVWRSERDCSDCGERSGCEAGQVFCRWPNNIRVKTMANKVRKECAAFPCNQTAVDGRNKYGKRQSIQQTALRREHDLVRGKIMNTMEKWDVMEKLDVNRKVGIEELNEVGARILDVRYHNHDGDLLLLDFYELPIGNFCHINDWDIFIGCDVNIKCYGSDLTYYYEEYLWAHMNEVKDGQLVGQLIDKPFSKLFYYEKGDFLENGDYLTVPVDKIVDVHFLNADIPDKQKMILANIYNNIWWETGPE